MDKYIDPENIEELKQELSEKRTLKDVLEFVNTIFPDWVIDFVDKYSDKYPFLTKNWYKTCENAKVNPTQIMIVDKVDFTDGHNLLKIFGELFTMSGFSVRSREQLVLCPKCGDLFPTSEIHTLFREAGENVPDVWGCCE